MITKNSVVIIQNLVVNHESRPVSWTLLEYLKTDNCIYKHNLWFRYSRTMILCFTQMKDNTFVNVTANCSVKEYKICDQIDGYWNHK